MMLARRIGRGRKPCTWSDVYTTPNRVQFELLRGSSPGFDPGADQEAMGLGPIWTWGAGRLESELICFGGGIAARAENV
jgi:hypothetical protein